MFDYKAFNIFSCLILMMLLLLPIYAQFGKLFSLTPKIVRVVIPTVVKHWYVLTSRLDTSSQTQRPQHRLLHYYRFIELSNPSTIIISRSQPFQPIALGLYTNDTSTAHGPHNIHLKSMHSLHFWFLQHINILIFSFVLLLIKMYNITLWNSIV